MQSAIKTIVAAAGITVLLGGAAARAQQQPVGADGPQSYSATAYQSAPGQPETRGRIEKSGQNLRLEFTSNGKPVVQIMRPGDGLMYILDPQTRTYMEIRGEAVPATATDGYVSPCPDQLPGDRCRMLGHDVVDGIDVERWAITTRPGSKPLVILWDSTRRRALRQDFPDGSATVMRFREMAEIDGRSAEHWSIEVTAPGQPPRYGDWWFDPHLRLVLREDLPGGGSRRLDDIVTGPVDPADFAPPRGWTKRTPPPPERGGN